MKNARPRTLLPLLLATVVVMALAGCRSSPSVSYARVYPAALDKGPTLDIQVVRGETTLTLTNATSRVFGPCTLWVNAYFSRPLDGLAVGQTVRIGLTELRNEHGESFRSGGFFATERPENMVLAQLEHDGTLYGLVVVRGEPVIK